MLVKATRLGTVDIPDSEQLAIDDQRHDDFGTRRGIAGDMPRKCIDIDDQLRLARRCGGSTDTATERNAHAGRLALERTNNQFATIEKVKPAPVDIRWASSA